MNKINLGDYSRIGVVVFGRTGKALRLSGRLQKWVCGRMEPKSGLSYWYFPFGFSYRPWRDRSSKARDWFSFNEWLRYCRGNGLLFVVSASYVGGDEVPLLPPTLLEAGLNGVKALGGENVVLVGSGNRRFGDDFCVSIRELFECLQGVERSEGLREPLLFENDLWVPPE